MTFDIDVDGRNLAAFTYDARGLLASKTLENGTTSTYTYDAAARLQAMRGIVPVTYSLNATGQRTGRHDAAFGPETFTYDVFGRVEIRSATGESVPESMFGNRFLFTGREWLSEIGLYDYRNRVYSAELGRFLQTDPIRFSAGDGNLYRYVGNNAVNLWDPWGLAPGDCYPTRDAAAQDAMRDIYGPSTEKDREHGGELYRKPDGSFSYTKPRMGDQHSVAIRPKSPGYEGYYHSHGAESGPKYDDEHFSKPDKQIAIDTGKPAYLVTPSGAMKNTTRRIAAF